MISLSTNPKEKLMLKLIKAFINTVKAEMQLQDELSRRYPFGCPKSSPEDRALIAEKASAWRKFHSFSNYMKLSSKQIDDVTEVLVYNAPLKEYSGAYGCFASDPKTGKQESSNIVCECGVDHVFAHNPEEAMDLMHANASKRTLGSDTSYYNDWILTELVVMDPTARYGHVILFRHGHTA